jgi:hypothetical protein
MNHVERWDNDGHKCSGQTFGDITFGERSGMLLVRAGKGNKVHPASNKKLREVFGWIDYQIWFSTCFFSYAGSFPVP